MPMFDILGNFVRDQKKKVLGMKIGKDKDPKVPDIIERLDELEARCAKLQDFFGRFKAEHYETLLFPLHAKFPEFSEEEVKEVAAELALLPEGFGAIKGGLDFLESKLLEK